MYNDRIVLSMQDILEKEFKIDARGYRLQEVDKFLDTIIGDYNEYNNIIKELENDKLSLEESVKKFEKGIELSNHCNTLLAEAEKSITVLIEKSNGEVTEEQFSASTEE